MSIERKILKWMASEHTGISSKAMAFCAVGIKNYHFSTEPSDPSDFERCLGLVKAVPEVKKKFPKIMKMSDKWERFLTSWDYIETLFLDEIKNQGCMWSAPKTYRAMKAIGL